MTKPSRAQLEIGLLVSGTLLLLWLYRSYLERSLDLQTSYMTDLLAEREREQAAGAGTNGKLALDDEHMEQLLEQLLARLHARGWPASGVPADLQVQPPDGDQ